MPRTKRQGSLDQQSHRKNQVACERPDAYGYINDGNRIQEALDEVFDFFFHCNKRECLQIMVRLLPIRDAQVQRKDEPQRTVRAEESRVGFGTKLNEVLVNSTRRLRRIGNVSCQMVMKSLVVEDSRHSSTP